MKTVRKLAAVLLAAVMMISVTACGGMSSQEAGDYVKSALDASYKGEFDDYVNRTKSTMEEAEQMYETNLQNVMAGAGLTDLGLSDELMAKYRDLFKEMLAIAKYEMVSSEKTEDGFDVTVSYARYTGMDNLDDEVIEALQSDLSALTKVPSEESLNEVIYGKMYELLSEKIKSPTYGDEGTMVIHVEKGDNNIYSISEDDLTELDSHLYMEE